LDEKRPRHLFGLFGSAREILTGVAAGVVLASLVGLPVVVHAYRRGKERGLEREQRRMLSREEAVRTRPLVEELPWAGDGSRIEEGAGRLSVRAATRLSAARDTGQAGTQTGELPGEEGAEGGDVDRDTPLPSSSDLRGAAAGPGVQAGPRGPRCFTPDQCVRIVWPMEIVKRSDGGGGRMFRIRQGANRFARPGSGLCEFAFRAHRRVVLSVFVRVRYSDECGNSLVVGVDGGTAIIGRTKVFGKWLWECASRRFVVGAGLHRLTIFTREDGIDFDRIVVSTKVPGPEGPPSAYLDAIQPTPAPAFESLPVASEVLPAVGAVTAEAMPTDSLVVGAGHRNTLTVFTRLNDDRPRNVRITVSGAATSGQRRRGGLELHLTRGQRTQFTEVKIERFFRGGYFLPVEVEVYAADVRVHSRTVNFVRPLDWAFLGPFPDPERKRLDLDLPPDAMTATLHLLPDIPGREWIRITDGSCYDEFGVVDLNRVYGLKNVPWREHGSGCDPKVAYAVTCLPSLGSRHACFAYAGDDCLRMWLNGRVALSQDGDAPLETTRQVIGTKLAEGLNVFVFKVPQTGYYWQLLFEPDTTFPYSHPETFRPLPMSAWSRMGGPSRPGQAAPAGH
jgi:hypothetical protein